MHHHVRERVNTIFANRSEDLHKEFKCVHVDNIGYVGHVTTNTFSTSTFNSSYHHDIYIPSMAYLHVEGYIAKSDGAHLTQDDNAKVALVNGGWNLFRRPVFTYNHQCLHVPGSDKCGILANINTLGSSYTKAEMDALGFYPDSGTGAADELDNEGWKTRHALTICEPEVRTRFGSSNQTLILPLRDVFGFCRDYEGPLTGGPLKLTIDRETNAARYLHAASGPEGMKFVITKLELWLPIIDKHSPLTSATYGHFQKKISFTDRSIATLDDAGNISPWHAGNFSPAVRRIAFTMCDYSADSDQTKNSTIFTDDGMNTLTITITIKHKDCYQEDRKYVRAIDREHGNQYQKFLKMFGKIDLADRNKHHPVIDLRSFETLYPIFCMDFSQYSFTAPVDVNVSIVCEPQNCMTGKTLVCIIETENEICGHCGHMLL